MDGFTLATRLLESRGWTPEATGEVGQMWGKGGVLTPVAFNLEPDTAGWWMMLSNVARVEGVPIEDLHAALRRVRDVAAGMIDPVEQGVSKPAAERNKGGRPPSACGTTPAYRRHLRNGEKPCAACTQSNREDRREERRRKGIKPRLTAAPQLTRVQLGEVLGQVEGMLRLLPPQSERDGHAAAFWWGFAAALRLTLGRTPASASDAAEDLTHG